MKKVLVIGSTVVDVVVRLHHLPVTGEDVNISSQTMSLGGCAYNVFSAVRRFGVPALLFSPVGTGTYGDYVRRRLAEEGIVSPIPTPEMDNGCCYCFVEHTGERTFVCHHGAEYLFREEWFSLLRLEEFDSVYVCGLEVEESTGEVLLRFLENHPGLRLYFAPGARIAQIPADRMERMLDLRPVLHLNEGEAMAAAGAPTAEEAAALLGRRTGSGVVVTLGARGAYVWEKGSGTAVEGVRARQRDTIGAGDAHAGALIACLQMGCSLAEAAGRANRVAAAVVEVPGALLPKERFDRLKLPTVGE